MTVERREYDVFLKKEKASEEFARWREEYPTEFEILRQYLSYENYLAFAQHHRHKPVFEQIRQALRDLGLDDHMLPYAKAFPDVVDQYVAVDGVEMSQEELNLLREINYGYWLKHASEIPDKELGVMHPWRR